MDPNNTLICCPAGHQLQVVRTDLNKVLCCPVCKQTFMPGGGPAVQAPPGSPAGPTLLSYADGTLPQPVTRPTYVRWLVGLWIVAEFLTAIGNYAQMAVGQDPQNPNPSFMFGQCFVILPFIAAVVLQLMWIYRIHADALRARGYREVSPGLALGLSFIPVFNLVWTAWTMKRLATFAAGGGEPFAQGAADVVRASATCLYFGVAKALAQCLGVIVGMVVVFRSVGAAGPAGPMGTVDPLASAGPGFHAFSAIITLVGLAAVLVYARTVPKVQDSLYRFLGAPA